MIVQVFRRNNAMAPLGCVWEDGYVNLLGDAASTLATQGLMLPEGWEDTPYGHPIIPVPIPKPPSLGDWWVNWYPDGPTAVRHGTEASADDAADRSRIAKVHVWTDEDGDHAEVIRT